MCTSEYMDVSNLNFSNTRLFLQYLKICQCSSVLGSFQLPCTNSFLSITKFYVDVFIAFLFKMLLLTYAMHTFLFKIWFITSLLNKIVYNNIW